MNNKDKKNLIIIGIIATILVIAAVAYFSGIKNMFFGPKPKVIQETLVIPETKNVVGTEGRTVNGKAAEVPLVPKGVEQEVIIPKAVLTLKDGYNLALPNANKWSTDSKLTFIKSLGAVTLDGRSSEWQVVFGSSSRKAGYEVVIQEHKIVSSKEVPSKAFGYDLPKNWYGSADAIVSLQAMPQFSDATISGINFYYNTDSKLWGYALATSKGTTSMIVR